MRLGVEATFAHAKPDPALRACLAPSGPLLVYAGRLSPEARHLVLPEVLAALPDSYSLAIAGSGISAAALARRARALGVAERVHMLGHLGDREALAALLATADCFVHSNANEPFGLAPLEAASAGCRVVIPNRAGAEDVLAPTGARLVADDAPATLAQGIADAMRTARPAACTADLGWPSVFASEWTAPFAAPRTTDAGRTVIFSIHDVAPQTLPQVAELRRMIHADAGPVPVSLLVVPRYHGADAWCPGSRRWLSDAATRGRRDRPARLRALVCPAGSMAPSLTVRWPAPRSLRGSRWRCAGCRNWACPPTGSSRRRTPTRPR